MNNTISVLLAVYEPNHTWLRELLKSIRSQTRLPEELLIWDDHSSQESFEETNRIVEQLFLESPVKTGIYRNETNEGSDRTFEKLIRKASGNLLAFCDQDDIWEAVKLEKLSKAFEEDETVTLVYSDMTFIDENGNQIMKSLREFRPGIEFVEGSGQTWKYLAINCTPACSMMTKAEETRRTFPLFYETYSDHWFAVCLSAWGRVVFVDEPLLRNRRHGENQTGFLEGIRTKEDYRKQRILPMLHLVEELEKRGIHYEKEDEALIFAKAREEGRLLRIWKYRRICQKYAKMDILMAFVPAPLTPKVLEMMRKRRRGKTG